VRSGICLSGKKRDWKAPSMEFKTTKERKR